MSQTVQILRASPPATLLPGALSVELGAQTKLWVGAAGGNRLLLSSDPADTAAMTGLFLKISGGTLTGLLTLSGPPTVNLHATTKLYVDTGDTAALNSAKAYADTQDNAIKAAYLPLAGGTLTGPLVLSGPPTVNLHAATKLYVDTADNLKAPLASPVFTGDPRAPTPAAADNDTSIATTNFVKLQGYATVGYVNGTTAAYLPLSGGTINGSLTVTSNLSVTAPGAFTAVGGTFNGNVFHNGACVVSNGIQYGPYGLTTPAVNIGLGYDYSDGLLWIVANGTNAGYLGPLLSDERLKRDTRPITVNPLAAIRQVQLKAFNQLSSRNDPADGMRAHDVGFIAQQLREVIPDAVIEPPMENAFLGVDLMPLVAYCVGAIQQLAQRLEEIDVRPD